MKRLRVLRAPQPNSCRPWVGPCSRRSEVTGPHCCAVCFGVLFPVWSGQCAPKAEEAGRRKEERASPFLVGKADAGKD